MEKQIPTEVYDRVCGYYRPVNQANKGKQDEINERKRWNANEFNPD